jgi:hypothetical protein
MGAGRRVRLFAALGNQMKEETVRVGSASILGALAALLVTAGIVLAAGYTLFGDAMIVSPGNNSAHAVQLRSECPGGTPACFINNTFTFGGIDFDIPAGTTFANFETLATDYKFTEGSCGGGGPRFQLNVESGTISGNIFANIGPPPSYTGCPPNIYAPTGDLLEGVNFLDTSQLPGGTFYDPYNVALTKYGSYVVTGVQLVTDGSWSQLGGVQTVHVDNVDIDGTIYTFDQPQTRGECKKHGYEVVTRADGSEFKNQGDCIQYFNTGK